MSGMNDGALYYGDCLDWMREWLPEARESVDLIYLDPPFKSNTNYNILFGSDDGGESAQMRGFEDTWKWDRAASERVRDIENAPMNSLHAVMGAFRMVLGNSGGGAVSGERAWRGTRPLPSPLEGEVNMGFITKIPHAIDTADRFTDGLRVLFNDYGDAAKWQQSANFPDEELGAVTSRTSQLVQLSYYGVELMLKVLYQQDYGKPFEGRNHRLLDIFDKLEKETKRRVEYFYAGRGDKVHGNLFMYPHSQGDARSVIAVCDGKYNFYRYEIFELDDTSSVDFSYDFAIFDVLQVLATTAKIRVPMIMNQYGHNIDPPASWQRPSAWPRPAAE